MVEGDSVFVDSSQGGTRERKSCLSDTSKIPATQLGDSLMNEDWVLLCQALYLAVSVGEWRDMHEKLKEVSKQIGVKKAEQKVTG